MIRFFVIEVSEANPLLVTKYSQIALWVLLFIILNNTHFEFTIPNVHSPKNQKLFLNNFLFPDICQYHYKLI
jgi:hypothetical protein